MTAPLIIFIDPAVDAEFIQWLAGVTSSEELELQCVGSLPAAVERLAESAAARRAAIAIIGLNVESRGNAARRLRKVDARAHLLFLTNSRNEEALRGELRFTPALGTAWSIGYVDDRRALAQAIRAAARAVSQRQQLRTTLDRINVQLATETGVDATDYRKLVISDRHLASILRHAPDAIIAADLEWRINVWNRAAGTIFGYTDEEAFGSALLNLIDRPDRDRFRRAVDGLTETREATLELRGCRADSTSFDVELTIAPILEDGGRRIGYSLIARDITERKSLERDRERLLEAERSARWTAEEAEKRFRDLVQSVGAIVSERDPETLQFKFVSRRAEELLGYEVERWIGDAEFWPGIIHPEDRARVVEGIRAAAESGGDRELEYRVIAASGEVRWLRDLVYVSKGGGQRVVRGLMVDVTTRKESEVLLEKSREELERRVDERTIELLQSNRALEMQIEERLRFEQALQKEEEFLKAILQNLEDGIVVADAGGRITLFNRAARELHGVTEEPTPLELWPEKYRLYDIHGALMNPDDVPLARALRGEAVRGVEMLIGDPERRRVVVASGQPIRTPHGEISGAVIAMHDITAHRQAERERERMIRIDAERAESEMARKRAAFLVETGSLLASSLDYQRTLAQLAQMLVPVLGDWCSIDLTEGAATRHVAVAHASRSADTAARSVVAIASPKIAPEELLREVVRSGQPKLVADVSKEGAAWEPFRRLGTRSCIAVPLVARGMVLGVMTLTTAESGRQFAPRDLEFATDVGLTTALHIDNAILYREAREANRAKDEFLATLSHELRTPMTAILGWTRMLRLGGLDQPTFDTALETIERSATAQAQLIEDVLDVSRIVTGKLRLQTEEVDVAAVVGTAVETVRPVADAKGITLTFEVRDRIPTVIGDPARLQQIVWNLLSNATKFTPRGGRVEVCVELGESVVRIVVRDSGQGIAPEFLPHVFERFRQAEGATTRSHGGLGLGLSIVSHLVELHGGRVSAQSAGVGKGAAFKVELPVPALRATAHDVELAVRDGSDFPDLGGAPILVVDDDADARSLIVAVLERCNADVTAAASVAEALNVTAKVPPRVIVSDIAMPVQDGYDLIRLWRENESDGRTPALALTAQGRAEDRDRAFAAGFDEFLRKPVEPIDLARTVAGLLERSA